MTDSEKLDLLLAEIRGTKDEVQSMKKDIRILKDDMKEVKEDVRSLKDDVCTLKGEMKEIKEDIRILKEDVHTLKGEMKEVKEDVRILKEDVRILKEDVQLLKKKVTCIELHLENSTDHNIQLIAENFIDLTNKLNQAIPAADNNRMYEVKVNYLIEEVKKLADEVSKIKEKTA
jgi:chromosome segregation ATPase